MKQYPHLHAPAIFILQNVSQGMPAFRNIHKYMETRWTLDPHGFCEILDRVIEACDLDAPSGNLDGARLARVAAVLAAALVRGSNTHQLKALYQRLERMPASAAMTELRTIMSRSDEFEAGPGLFMRGFGSAGARMHDHARRLLTAYEVVGTLLQRANAGFIRPCINRYDWRFGKSVAPTVKRAFHRYFGRLDATVAVKSLEFMGGRRVVQNVHTIQHARLVANVLEEIRKRYYSRKREESVVFVYGGRRLIPGALAYASARTDQQDASMLLNDSSFDALTVDGLAKTILHELTHAWLSCDDHAYNETCFALAKNSPGKALTNADSYAYFIAEAFQFGRRTLGYGARLEREPCGFAAMKR